MCKTRLISSVFVSLCKVSAKFRLSEENTNIFAFNSKNLQKSIKKENLSSTTKIFKNQPKIEDLSSTTKIFKNLAKIGRV